MEDNTRLQDAFPLPPSNTVSRYWPAWNSFESPIEEELANALVKYVHEDAEIENQPWVSTPNGNFRLDFLVSINGLKVAIEANGKDFHDDKTDVLRESLLLGFTDIDSIFYLRGCDIHYNIATTLWAISLKEPRIFSSRGIKNLSILTEIREDQNHNGLNTLKGFLLREEDEPREPIKTYEVVYLSKSDEEQPWRQLYQLAILNPRLSIQELRELANDLL